MKTSCLAHSLVTPKWKEEKAMTVDYAAINLFIAVIRLGIELFKLIRDTKKPF